MAKDALGAHARDELGISEITTARPIQAALTSAATFSIGAAAPLALVLFSPSTLLIPVVSAGSLLFLALLGFLGAKTGGAEILKPMVRVTFSGRICHGCDRRDRRNRRHRCLRAWLPSPSTRARPRLELVTPLQHVGAAQGRAIEWKLFRAKGNRRLRVARTSALGH